jgi:large subunit ribosomal protein L7/L12
MSSSSIVIRRSIREQLLKCNAYRTVVSSSSLLNSPVIQQQDKQQYRRPVETTIRLMHQSIQHQQSTTTTNRIVQQQQQTQQQQQQKVSTILGNRISLINRYGSYYDLSLRLLSTTQPPPPAPPTDASSSTESATTESTTTPTTTITDFTNVKQYSIPELTRDAAIQKAGFDDPTCPKWQNPLHHNNDDYNRQFPEDFANEEEFKKHIRPAPPMDGDGIPQYIKDIAEEMVHLTLLEMNELANKIADHYGFHEGMLSPDDDDMDGSGNGSGGIGLDDDGDDAAAAAAAAASAVPTKFDLKLIEYDASSKIKVIKEVRSVAGLGLKEAKEAVEGAPKTIMKDLSKDQAEELKKKFEDLGAKVEIV